MTTDHEAAKQIISLCTTTLNLTPPDRAFLFRFLISQARNSSRALETVRAVYELAASGEWTPGAVDLGVLVYAPLDNPSIIDEIRGSMERILEELPINDRFRAGWRYVDAVARRKT
jgi:hypothetical protein